MKTLKHGLAASGLLGLALLAGCGSGGGTGVAPIIPVGVTLNQFAYVATQDGIEVFPVSGAGAVANNGVDPATTQGSGGLAVAQSGAFLVEIDGQGDLSSFTINPATGALTAVSTHVPAIQNTGATGFADAIALDPSGSFGVAVCFDSTSTLALEGFTVNPATGAITAVGNPQNSSAAPNSGIFEASIGQNANGTEVGVVGTTTGNFDAFPITAGNANLGARITSNVSGNLLFAVDMLNQVGIQSDFGGVSTAFRVDAGNNFQSVGNTLNLTGLVEAAGIANVGSTTVGLFVNNQATHNVIPITVSAQGGEALFTGGSPTATVTGQGAAAAFAVPPAISGGLPLALVVSTDNALTTTSLSALVIDPTGQNLTTPALVGAVNTLTTAHAPANSSNLCGVASFVFTGI